MEKSFQAVYRNGVLQPLESVALEERQQVTVTISDPTIVCQDLAGCFTPEEWAESSMTISAWMKLDGRFAQSPAPFPMP